MIAGASLPLFVPPVKGMLPHRVVRDVGLRPRTPFEIFLRQHLIRMSPHRERDQVQDSGVRHSNNTVPRVLHWSSL
jgi:hypothetical protein